METGTRTLPDGSLEVTVKGTTEEDRIITEDDLQEKFGVDLERYEMTRFLPNAWETHFGLPDGNIFRATNFQAKATFTLRKEVVQTENYAELFRELVADYKPRTLKARSRKVKPDEEEIAVVMDLFDLHIGMLAWAEETGDKDYDSYTGTALALEAVDSLIARLDNMNITKVIFPMGNDLLHSDNTIQGSGGATTGGTSLDVDTRYLKMYRMALNLMIEVIDRLRDIAPVEVIVVPGNHDQERMAFMGETISAWYRNDPEVEVNNQANLRKYTLFGTTLMGFTHGQGEKADSLPLIMASEQKELWAKADFKVFHTGHFHRKRKMLSVTTETYNGVEVITIPSLVPPDAWHAMKGFVGGGRAAEAHLVGATSGPCGYFRYGVPQN